MSGRPPSAAAEKFRELRKVQPLLRIRDHRRFCAMISGFACCAVLFLSFVLPGWKVGTSDSMIHRSELTLKSRFTPKFIAVRICAVISVISGLLASACIGAPAVVRKETFVDSGMYAIRVSATAIIVVAVVCTLITWTTYMSIIKSVSASYFQLNYCFGLAVTANVGFIVLFFINIHILRLEAQKSKMLKAEMARRGKEWDRQFESETLSDVEWSPNEQKDGF